MRHSDSSPPIPPRFVAFARRYHPSTCGSLRRTPGATSTASGLVSRCPRPGGLYDGDDEASRVPGKPTRTHATRSDPGEGAASTASETRRDDLPTPTSALALNAFRPAQLRGLRAPCERFAPWVTPGPRITRFRLAADLGRMGLDTHRVSNKVSKITSRPDLVRASTGSFPAHAGYMKIPSAGGAAWLALLWTLRRSHTTGMKSKVHPRYKTKYRVANWPAYNQALVRRGDVTVWLSSEAIAAWTPRRSGQRGGQRRYSDLAIETALTLRLLYHLPLRQAEGFLRALFGMMRLDLAAPDYTTLSRRSQHLRRRLRLVPPGEGLHLVLDSTGLSIVGEGEWATAKHGGRGRRGWRKLHLGVDQSGGIRVHTLTEETGDDATTALDLLTAVEGPLVRITADAAYDTVAVYETATARGATVVIPPARTATVSGHGPRSPARDRTITAVKQLGRRRWKKTSGYHRQSRVENTFFRYKSIIGDGLRARSSAGQGSEVVLGCEILNRMTALGRPVSYRIGR